MQFQVFNYASNNCKTNGFSAVEQIKF